MAEEISVHSGSSMVIPPICSSNKAFDTQIDNYPEQFKLMATAVANCSLIKTLTISKSVPIQLVTEAIQTFQKMDSNSFQFKLFNKYWKVDRNKFSELLKIPTPAEVRNPKDDEIIDMVNQMGHEPALEVFRDFSSSKLPDQWVVLYNAVSSLCAKNTGHAKMNKTQLSLMYALYHGVNVDFGKIIYESFISVCEARKGKIVCHRYWSVLIADTIAEYKKRNPQYKIPSHYTNMAILVEKAPSPKRSGIVFSHPGHVPQAMILRIPADNPVRKAYDKKMIVSTRRIVSKGASGSGSVPVRTEPRDTEQPEGAQRDVETAEERRLRRREKRKKKKSRTFSKSKFADMGEGSKKRKFTEGEESSKKEKRRRLKLKFAQPKHTVMVSSPEYETDPDASQSEARTHVSNSLQGSDREDDFEMNDDITSPTGDIGAQSQREEAELDLNAQIQGDVNQEKTTENVAHEGSADPNASKAGGEADRAQVHTSNVETTTHPHNQSDDVIFGNLGNIGTMPNLTDSGSHAMDFGDFAAEHVITSNEPLQPISEESTEAEEDTDLEVNRLLHTGGAMRADVVRAQNKILRSLRRMHTCSSDEFSKVNEKLGKGAHDGAEDVLATVQSLEKTAAEKLNSFEASASAKHTEVMEQAIAHLSKEHEKKMLTLQKEHDAKYDTLLKMFEKEKELLNKKVDLAQAREDQLSKDVKELKDLVVALKPTLESVAKVQPVFNELKEGGLKKIVEESLSAKLDEQRVQLDTKLDQRLAPLASLQLIVRTLVERRKEKEEGGASGATQRQGGEFRILDQGTRHRHVPPPDALTALAHRSRSSTSLPSQITSTSAPVYMSSTVSAPIYTSSTTLATHSSTTGTTFGSTSSQSATMPSSSTSTPMLRHLGITMEKMREILAKFRSYGVIKSLPPGAPIPNDEESLEKNLDDDGHTLLCKYAVILAKGTGNTEHRLGPYREISSKPTDCLEFDFGVLPTAYLYPVGNESPGYKSRSSEYNTRLMTWYAMTAKDPSQVWTLKRIYGVMDVVNLPQVLGGIENVSITVERKEVTKAVDKSLTNSIHTFTLADLPAMNLGDIITMFRVWSKSTAPLLQWIAYYLKNYIYFYYMDVATKDREIGTFINVACEAPDFKFSCEKGKYKVGEIIHNTDGNGIKVYYEATISESSDKSSQRVLVMRQIHLYPSNTLRNVLSRVKGVTNKNKKLRQEVIDRIEWVLEFRNRMLELPNLCFPEKIGAIWKANQEKQSAQA